MSPRLSSLGALSLLLAAGPVQSAVFNYSAQLPHVLVQVYGNAIEYRVFDPAKGRYVGLREGGASIQNVVSKDGIVAWSDGSVLQARFYDPNRGAWRAIQVASPTVEQMRVQDGVLAWSNPSLVNQLVYDLCRASWRLHQEAAINPVTRLQTDSGLVAWNGGRTVFLNVYNPARGAWIVGRVNAAMPAEDLMTRHGIVAWSSGGVVNVRTFDPEANRWIVAEIESPTPAGMKIDNGVVAWKAAGRIYFAAYDPMRQLWRPGQLEAGEVTDLEIRAGTVTYTDSERIPVIRGYSVDTGKWFSGMTVPFASFGASTISNEAPKTVYFYDRSLGASGWGWSFDDGEFRFERAPHHHFSDPSLYRVSLMVHGPHGMSSGAAADIDLSGEGAGEAGAANAAAGGDEDFQRLESSRTAEGLLQIDIHGTPGDEVELQASANLADWTTIAELSNSTGTVHFVDPDSGHLAHRYYRARVTNR